MRIEIDYEKMFEPYRIDFSDKEQDFKLIIEKKDEAFELFQNLYNLTYGTININENLVSIHTGGWSENELIISEFKKTFWWTTAFWGRITGGHYYFNTDRNAKKEWDIIPKLNN